MEALIVLFVALVILVPILLAVIAVARVNSLHARLTTLEENLRQLQGAVSREGVSLPHEPLAEKRSVADTRSTLEEEMAVIETHAAAARAREALPPEPPAVVPPAPPPTHVEWESLVGGKFLNRIGALALIIGIGFFLKYAFDQNWLSETVRVSIGAGIGGGLLAAGHRFLRRGMPVFAQGLIGAGIAILYLSVYASFNFYHLVSQPVAFVLMASVTIITFAEALVTNALAVSLLGWAGGFLTPFLLSTGSANMVGLFSYIALLDTGLILAVYKKPAWGILEPLTVGATYLIYLLWHVEYFTPTSLGPALAFVTLFWALFLAVDITRLRENRQTANPLAHLTAAANMLFYLLALLNLLEGEQRIWRTAATLLLAAVSLLMTLAGRRRHNALGTTEQRHATATVLLLVTATWIQLDGLELAIALGIEAGLFLHLALKSGITLIRGLSLALIGVALAVFIEALPILHAQGEFPLILNERMLASLIFTAVILFAAHALERQTTPGLTLIRGLLHAVWSVMPLIPITLEIFDIFTGGEPQHSFDAPYMLATMAMSWVGYAVLLFRIAAAYRFTTALHSSFWVVMLSLLVALPQGFAYAPMTDYRSLLNHRALTLLVQAAGMFLLAYWTRKELRHSWAPAVSQALQIAGILALIVLCTGETLDYFRKEITAVASEALTPLQQAGIVHGLRDQQQLSLSGIWLLCAVVLMILGLWYRKRLFRIIAIVLSVATIAKVSLVDLSFLNTLYRIFSFVGLGVILLVVSYLYQHYSDVIFKDRMDTPEPEKSPQ